jgi:hypothetical protein
MMQRMRLLWLALVLAGCGRLGFDEEPTGVPSHVAGGVSAGSVMLSLVDATIDTTSLTIDGVTRDDFVVRAQPNGPEVAVLSVASLDVSGMVRVVGTRPFIVYATGVVAIGGLLDAGARGAEPGAGGYVDGPGHGASAGKPVADVCDPGGGGGGFGGAGGAGGATDVPTSGSGGAGGSDAQTATPGVTADFNPGGGGGGVGRIVVRTL